MAVTYEPIATQTLGSAAGSVTFSSIPSTYTDLVLVTNVIGTGDLQVNGRLNGDSGANYSSYYFVGNGTTGSGARQNNANYFATDYYFSVTTNGNATVMHFMNYSNATGNKSILVRSNAADKAVMAITNIWSSTAAINSIALTASQNNFNTGSMFTLYGIKAA